MFSAASARSFLLNSSSIMLALRNHMRGAEKLRGMVQLGLALPAPKCGHGGARKGAVKAACSMIASMRESCVLHRKCGTRGATFLIISESIWHSDWPPSARNHRRRTFASRQSISISRARFWRCLTGSIRIRRQVCAVKASPGLPALVGCCRSKLPH